MRNSKIVIKRIRNIVILGMMLMIVIGTYINIRNSRAEDVTEEVLLKLTDIEGRIKEQEVNINATENEDGTYSVELTNVVNSYVINNFYTEDEEKILYDGEEEIETETEEETLYQEEQEITEEENIENTYKEFKLTLTLTEEEIENKEINLKAKYDTKTTISKELTNETEDQDSNDSEETENENENETIVVLYNKRFIYNDEIAVTGYM